MDQTGVLISLLQSRWARKILSRLRRYVVVRMSQRIGFLEILLLPVWWRNWVKFRSTLPRFKHQEKLERNWCFGRSSLRFVGGWIRVKMSNSTDKLIEIFVWLKFIFVFYDPRISTHQTLYLYTKNWLLKLRLNKQGIFLQWTRMRETSG